MFGSKPKHSFLDICEGIIIGGSLAAAATFLFGTKKGKELRQEAANQYKKVGTATKRIKSRIGKFVKAHTPTKTKKKAKKQNPRKAA